MTTKDGEPRVFGDGDLTMAVGQSGFAKIYVGQMQIGLVQSLKVEFDAASVVPTVEIRFPSRDSVSAELDMKIDEYARLLAPYQWIRVLR